MADEPTNIRPQLSQTELAAQQRIVAVRILRMTFVVLIATVTLVYILGRSQGTLQQADNPWTRWIIPSGIAVIVVFGLLTLDIFTPRKRLGVIFGIFFGALAGVLVTGLLAFIIDLFVQTYIEEKATRENIIPLVTAVKVLLGIGCSYLAITTVLQTQDDFRLVIPYVEFAKQIRGSRPLLLDSSAMIDARVNDLALTGIIQTPLVVPRCVLLELQALADSDDKLNRTKGRRGLDAVTKLQRTPGIDISIDETPVPGKGVDQMLIELARTMPAVIVTTDANLSRVAGIQNVTVLNLNDVANALKPSLIPGSQLEIRVARAGEQPGQGVGFLDDGTMLVIDRGEEAIGTSVRVEVTSAMQTSAGRLIFARNLEAAEGHAEAAPSASEQKEPPSPADVNPGSAAGSQPIADPLTVKPPTKPLKPGPFGPNQFGKTPNRNPRRG